MLILFGTLFGMFGASLRSGNIVRAAQDGLASLAKRAEVMADGNEELGKYGLAKIVDESGSARNGRVHSNHWPTRLGTPHALYGDLFCSLRDSLRSISPRKGLGLRPAGGQAWLVEMRGLADRSEGSSQWK